MTEKQKYAIKLAISTMGKYFGRHYNTVYGNRKTGVTVGYDEAINILSDMVTDNDNKPTNADRIRNMSDYDLGDLLQSVSSGAGNGNPFISLCVDDNEITMDFSDIYEWLQSEAE